MSNTDAHLTVGNIAAEGFAGGMITLDPDRAPEALRQAKRAIRQGVDQPIEQGLALEQVAFDQTMFTGHAAKAMRAYLSADVMLGDMDYDFSDDD